MVVLTAKIVSVPIVTVAIMTVAILIVVVIVGAMTICLNQHFTYSADPRLYSLDVAQA